MMLRVDIDCYRWPKPVAKLSLYNIGKSTYFNSRDLSKLH